MVRKLDFELTSNGIALVGMGFGGAPAAGEVREVEVCDAIAGVATEDGEAALGGAESTPLVADCELLAEASATFGVGAAAYAGTAAEAVNASNIALLTWSTYPLFLSSCRTWSGVKPVTISAEETFVDGTFAFVEATAASGEGEAEAEDGTALIVLSCADGGPDVKRKKAGKCEERSSGSWTLIHAFEGLAWGKCGKAVFRGTRCCNKAGFVSAVLEGRQLPSQSRGVAVGWSMKSSNVCHQRRWHHTDDVAAAHLLTHKRKSIRA